MILVYKTNVEFFINDSWVLESSSDVSVIGWSFSITTHNSWVNVCFGVIKIL
jgi:hypothetical protein